MRTILLTLATLVLLAGCQQPQENADQSMSLVTLSPAAYRGRWLLINYWAIWCEPCREEIPALNRLAQDHPDDVAVVGVDFDGHQGEELLATAGQLGIRFATATEDPAPALGLQRPHVLPASYIIDPEGNLAHQLYGPQRYVSLVELLQLEPGAAATIPSH